MENQLDTQKRKWIYIIKRNGMVYELLLGDESYQSLFTSWNRKEHIMVKDLNNEPIGVNAVDIVDILPENQYSNFIETLAPTKNYIVKVSSDVFISPIILSATNSPTTMIPASVYNTILSFCIFILLLCL